MMRRLLSNLIPALLIMALGGCTVNQAPPGISPVPPPPFSTTRVSVVPTTHRKVADASLDKDLLSAVRKGDSEKVSSLLAKGANANAQDSKGQYAISLAAEAPLSSRTNGMGLNGVCCTIIRHRGYQESVTALVKAGAMVNVRNSEGITPLQQAQSSEEVAWSIFCKNPERGNKCARLLVTSWERIDETGFEAP